jgi:hypothetical protein
MWCKIHVTADTVLLMLDQISRFTLMGVGCLAALLCTTTSVYAQLGTEVCARIRIDPRMQSNFVIATV